MLSFGLEFSPSPSSSFTTTILTDARGLSSLVRVLIPFLPYCPLLLAPQFRQPIGSPSSMAPGHESSFPKHESQPPSDPDIKSETPSPPQSIHYFGAPTRSRLAETRPSGVGSPGSSRPSPEATINNKTRQSRRAACPRFVATSTEESSHIEDSTKSLTRELVGR